MKHQSPRSLVPPACKLRSLLMLARIAVPLLVALAWNSPLAGGQPAQIEHIIVIYQENHSFDSYFGTFPGADGIANAGASAVKMDKRGHAYQALPAPLGPAVEGARYADP